MLDSGRPRRSPRRDQQRRVRVEVARRFLVPALLILSTILVGMGGYMLIEGWPLVDALYMTILTLTTIGYGEPFPLSSAGEIFTIGMMLATIAVAGYALSTVATFIFEGELNRMLRGRRMDRRITQMADHVILCGLGRTGYCIAEEFSKTQTPFVAIERNPETLEAALLTLGDILFLEADSTHDETLRAAGIERAVGLIAALGDDKDNLFIVLSARTLNPDLRIIARAQDDDNAAKMRRVGANEVVSPNAIGGLRMASVMIRPKVVSFLDEMLRVPGETLRISELDVDRVPGLVGMTLAEANIPARTGMLVVAIIGAEQGYRFNPRADTVLHHGDTLIVMGTPEQRAAFLNLAVGE